MGQDYLNAWLPVGVYLAILVGFAALLIILSHILQPRRVPTRREFREPFECGLKSDGLPPGRYPVKYYLAAIMFVVFDLEAIFLYPWAVCFQQYKDAGLAWLWFSEMLAFILILLAGYAFILAKGVFGWPEE